jgi:murein DD-endopeptidase MepM/ murein hydrolase activator NlpD
MFLFAHAEASQQPEIVLEPEKLHPGGISVVTIHNALLPIEGTFDGRKLYWFLSAHSKNSYKAIISVDLYAEPGQYELNATTGTTTLFRLINVSKKKYPVQRLKLPRGMVELSPENKARVERDQKKISALWPVESDRAWSGSFNNPLPGKPIGTPFGVRRIINKIPKSSHSGIDMTAEEGENVFSPNNGVVVLVDDLFYSGNSIVLDHGQGIYTMFFHLSKILVTQGQRVAKGDVIGLVGSTGRSTGAHLHWGVRIQGARVDPMELIKLNLE